MLSFKNNFLFIHLPKTGGNSLQNVLSEHSEDRIVCLNDLQDGVERFEVRNEFEAIHKHSTLTDYSKCLTQEKLDSLYKFTTVRNPWDRMISFYFSPHRRCSVWNRNEFIVLVNSIKTLPDMVWHDCTKPWHANMDFIINFDRLEPDFEQVCHHLNIPFSGLPKRNSSVRNDYRQYYDEELIQLVRDKFQHEIEFGDFTF